MKAGFRRRTDETEKAICEGCFAGIRRDFSGFFHVFRGIAAKFQRKLSINHRSGMEPAREGGLHGVQSALARVGENSCHEDACGDLFSASSE